MERVPVKYVLEYTEKVTYNCEVIAKVKAAKGIFFTGGVQERIVDVVQELALSSAIRSATGVVV